MGKRKPQGLGGGSGRGRGGGSGGRGSGGNRSNQGGVCFEWRSTGACKFGSRCKFRHVGAGTGRQQKTPAKIQRPSDATAKYIRHLATLPAAKLGTELVNSESLWRRCWQEQASLDAPTMGLLVEVLTRIPVSSSVVPPPVDDCEALFEKYLQNQIQQETDDNAVLTAVKTVLDTVKRLLWFEWEAQREDVKELLSNIIVAADGKLKKKRKEHLEVARSLMEVLSDMDLPWRIKIKEVVTIGDEGTPDSLTLLRPLDFSDWKGATVEWLTEAKFFSPACCPVMKAGPQRGVYDDADDYMDTVLRLWIAMTFFDGFSTVAPRCRTRGQSGTCSNPLWPVASGCSYLGSMYCRSKGCKSPVLFACRSKSHDALCEKCALQSISRHVGAPGPNASTHIYDAGVKSMTSDGVLFLTGFESRNPPTNAIHWRSTKRLAQCNLVGVVLLRKTGAALSLSDSIKWGMVEPHGNSKDEARRRENGEVKVNLSSILDCEPDYFAEGSQVAVVDCMTFVPEWIPVLRALESQKDTRLPFDNGKYLNLWKAHPVDTSNSVLDTFPSKDDIFTSSRRDLIVNMVDESQLEPIREVRRDVTLKEQLVGQLESLVVQTTLDKMQLIAFIDALRNPVHLTQGPPGTGKQLFCRIYWLHRTAHC